jgi:hypothetical protein
MISVGGIVAVYLFNLLLRLFYYFIIIEIIILQLFFYVKLAYSSLSKFLYKRSVRCVSFKILFSFSLLFLILSTVDAIVGFMLENGQSSMKCSISSVCLQQGIYREVYLGPKTVIHKKSTWGL